MVNAGPVEEKNPRLKTLWVAKSLFGGARLAAQPHPSSPASEAPSTPTAAPSRCCGPLRHVATDETLHFGLRVADPERSLAFYAALGYEVVGSVPGTSIGDLTMIKLPGDAFVTIDLVAGSSANAPSFGDGLSHLVIQVGSMDGVLAELAAEGITPDEAPGSPGRWEEFRTAWVTDLD